MWCISMQKDTLIKKKVPKGCTAASAVLTLWQRREVFCRWNGTQCRGICRGEENAKFLIFELDESRILIRKNQYEQIEDRSMNLKCRLYRSKWVQSIAASDVMESGQVVENPMIGAIPSRNEVQRELDDLLMSM